MLSECGFVINVRSKNGKCCQFLVWVIIVSSSRFRGQNQNGNGNSSSANSNASSCSNSAASTLNAAAAAIQQQHQRMNSNDNNVVASVAAAVSKCPQFDLGIDTNCVDQKGVPGLGLFYS